MLIGSVSLGGVLMWTVKRNCVNGIVLRETMVMFQGLSLSPNTSLKQKKVTSRKSILVPTLGTSPSTPTLVPASCKCCMQTYAHMHTEMQTHKHKGTH